MTTRVADRVRELLADPDNVRNISVIAHVDHGKSTLTDSLVAAAGVLNKTKAGTERIMDTDQEEKDRGITIHSTSVSLPFWRVKAPPNPRTNPDWPAPKPEATEEKRQQQQQQPEEQHESFLINLIDSPGHVDFSPEVTAALRVTDGALVVVDCVEGVRVQTRTVLRQALAERIRPILFLNKLDRIFLELQMDPEEAYMTLRNTVEQVNVVISSYAETGAEAKSAFGDPTVWPQNGTVGFGSGLQGWAFTLRDFAKMYHEKFGVSVRKMMKKLWGGNFWDKAQSKWTTEQYNAKGKRNQRGFTMLVLKPMRQLIATIKAADPAKVAQSLRKINVDLTAEELQQAPKNVVKMVLQRWLPAGPCLRDMIVDKLPSPRVAQAYRTDLLYQGPPDDECAMAMRACDPNGPLMLCVTKMVPTADFSRFYAFGRVFSGTVRAGEVVRIQGPDYDPAAKGKTDLHKKKISNAILMMANRTTTANEVPCGNLCALVGIDDYLVKTGTITTSPTAHNFVSMKYTVAPVVRVAVTAANPSDNSKLSTALGRLAKVDPLVLCTTSPTGEHIIAGAGELHLEICVKALETYYMKGCRVKVSEPVVTYCESVTAPASQVCIGKSPNKLNRLHVTAEPLSTELCQAVEDGRINLDTRNSNSTASKVRARLLADEFKWDVTEARKIWCFGTPPDSEANVLVDGTRGVSYLHDIRESVASSFQRCTAEGVLAGEPLRGIKVIVQDAKVHSDAPHRGAGQIMPCTRAAVCAAQLASKPCLLEPMYACEVTVPRSHVAGVYTTLRKRRAELEGTEEAPGSRSVDLCVVKAFLPVASSFGFAGELQGATSGEGFTILTFSHWAPVPGDVMEPGSNAHRVLMEIRKRKGLKPELPTLSDFHSRI